MRNLNKVKDKFSWGRVAPKPPERGTPRRDFLAPPNAVERIFGVCHNRPRPSYQQPMIAMVKKYLAGRGDLTSSTNSSILKNN